MFNDQRSKRVIFLAHCLLNQNAISDGTADYPAAHREVVRTLLDAQVSIAQMPCPELCCLGLDRGDPLGAQRPVVVENTRIRRAMGQPETAAKMETLVQQVVNQIREYHRNGFTVLGIVGMDRSPCCGVNTTSDEDRELEGQGVFMAAVLSALEEAGLRVPVVGVKAANALERIQMLLGAEDAAPAQADVP
ncbi:CD3072 family TudS-related putative desulfidase [uncultured Dysosmobacter sp.]|uniref:CD3072 family TudS-related putative desulfidase n=1 Tax=uncultured Dysosmobacter sp. TaxID=2591384 RepID=UPI002634723D|nr:CD3072 family TudS-related putative desulfidase [uncultured Dysosmobacter sp.]